MIVSVIEKKKDLLKRERQLLVHVDQLKLIYLKTRMNVSSTKTAILILQYTTNNRSTIPFILVLSIYF